MRPLNDEEKAQWYFKRSNYRSGFAAGFGVCFSIASLLFWVSR